MRRSQSTRIAAVKRSHSSHTLTTDQVLDKFVDINLGSESFATFQTLDQAEETFVPTFEDSYRPANRSHLAVCVDLNRSSSKVRTGHSSSTETSDTDDSIPNAVVFDNVPVSPRPKSNGSMENYERRPVSASDRSLKHEQALPRLTKSRSYHDSLVDKLGQDARQLTEQLNSFNGERPPLPELVTRVKIGQLATQSKADRKASARALVKDLRPRLDSRIEVLPISKEKQASLTCTRPTFLPPKSRKEEKKHLKQYEKLMLGSIEAEKKSQKHKTKQLNSKAKFLTNSADTWHDQILPHFDTAIRDPRTKKLWWAGLPNRVRGTIWRTCVGNTLAVSEETYRMALEQSRKAEHSIQSNLESPDLSSGLSYNRDSYAAIEQSVACTFTDLRIFQQGGPLHQSLVDLLKAYVYYKQDVMINLLDGLNHIAAVFLMYMTPPDAFILLVNVLNRALPLALYTQDEPAINRFLSIFMTSFSQRLPRLYHHFQKTLRLPPLLYLEPLLSSFFARQCPLDITSRVFDVYAFEGDNLLLRVALTCLIMLEHALYGNVQEVLEVIHGTSREHVWQNKLRSDDAFMKMVQSVTL